ncbi:hypothetical protein [Nonomuraea sp. NPDC005501]|uniref:hypothetical protein n=1 Tax=Nonomuraea sp. NPDC005501 TaxID=3156884 RepID=UPI00339FF5F9
MSPDDIWRQFGITTSHIQRKRLQMVVSGCLSLALLAAAMSWSGAITPHISWSLPGFFVHADVDENGVLSSTLDIDIENEGLTSFTLTGLTAEMPGLRLLPADEEVTMAIGGFQTVRRRVVITDCAAVPHEPQPVRFTYTTWVGSGSAEVTWGSWQLTGPEGQVPVAWQRAVAVKVCNEAMSPEWS